MPYIMNVSIPAERARAILPCSTTLGCAITLPITEKISNVTIGDNQYSVQVQSDGTSSAPRILVYPMRLHGEETRLDILAKERSYVVILEPDVSHITRSLTFAERPPLPPRFIPPTPLRYLPETASLDPQMISYSWQYSGDSLLACVSTFEYRRSAVWCKLPHALTNAPSVYAHVGKEFRPVDTRIVDREYLVIESIDGPFVMDVESDGAQYHGTLEHTHAR